MSRQEGVHSLFREMFYLQTCTLLPDVFSVDAWMMCVCMLGGLDECMGARMDGQTEKAQMRMEQNTWVSPALDPLQSSDFSFGASPDDRLKVDPPRSSAHLYYGSLPGTFPEALRAGADPLTNLPPSPKSCRGLPFRKKPEIVT